jgi:hypothetical protein
MTQPSGRLAASRRAQRSKAVVGHHSQFVVEHTHWPATTTNEKTITRHSRGLWFRYSGRLLNPFGDRRLRAIRVLRSLPLCKGLPHLRGAGRQYCARGLAGGETTLGRRATRSNPACGEWRPRVCQRFVLRTAFQSQSASKNTPARGRSAASNWRASTRCAPSSASVWREVKRRLGFLLLRAGGLKGDGVDCHIACPSPWHVATSVGRPATSSPTASPSPMSQIDVEVDVDRAARQAIDGVVVRR